MRLVFIGLGENKLQLAVTNNDEIWHYLIQSWVENADGVKDGQFYRDASSVCDEGKKAGIRTYS